MEHTGGEPDVVGQDEKTGEYIFTIAPRKVLKSQKYLLRWRRGK